MTYQSLKLVINLAEEFWRQSTTVSVFNTYIHVIQSFKLQSTNVHGQLTPLHFQSKNKPFPITCISLKTLPFERLQLYEHSNSTYVQYKQHLSNHMQHPFPGYQSKSTQSQSSCSPVSAMMIFN